VTRSFSVGHATRIGDAQRRYYEGDVDRYHAVHNIDFVRALRPGPTGGSP